MVKELVNGARVLASTQCMYVCMYVCMYLLCLHYPTHIIGAGKKSQGKT